MSDNLQEVEATNANEANEANEAMHLQALAHHVLTVGAPTQEEADRVAKMLYANGWRAEDVK